MDFSCIYVDFLLLEFILASAIESPTSGPYTEIQGGTRPFHYGDTVTYNCIVVGGKPLPDIKWICFVPTYKENIIKSGRKLVKQISIQVNETKQFHPKQLCACHVKHQTWNRTQVVESAPILIRTAPVIGSFRQVYSAEQGKPLTIKIDYYAYPIRVGAVVNKKYYEDIASDNVTKTFKKKQNLHFMAIGQSFQADGESLYWRTSSFNESDYGPYVVLLVNDEGSTKINFNITRKGAPAEPYNVNMENVTNDGFMLFFTPGYNGGYPQTFTLVYWPVNDRPDSRHLTSTSSTIHVRYMTPETNYSLLLYAENEKGRSVESHIGPWFVKTKVGVGSGSHGLTHILYGIGALCGVCLVIFVALVIVTCCKRKKPPTGIEEPSSSYRSPTSTLNTDRAVYVDRAVYRRTDGLPDTDTVDRLTKRPKPKLAIKVPPILAVFRKSRALPDAHVLSDVHTVVSPSSTDVTNENAANRQREDQRQLPSSSARQLNYPHIEIRNSERRSPATIPRRQTTNYIEIDFDARGSMSGGFAALQKNKSPPRVECTNSLFLPDSMPIEFRSFRKITKRSSSYCD